MLNVLLGGSVDKKRHEMFTMQCLALFYRS